VKPRLNCVLIRGLKEGRGGGRGETSGGALRLRAGERKGVGWRWGGDPDRRAPAGSEGGEEEGKGEGAGERAPGVSDWKKKEKGERGRCWAAAANGPEEGAGPCGVRWVAGFWAKREG
jgi:hypothetical protein